MEIQIPQSDILERREGFITDQMEWNSQFPTFLWHHLAGGLKQKWKFRLSAWHLLVREKVGLQVFLFFLFFSPQYLIRVSNYCLSVSVLLGCLFLVLCLAQTGFWEGLFFACAHWYFQVAGFLSNHSAIYEATVRPRILTTISYPKLWDT